MAIRNQTAANTASPEAARAALVRMGLYTKEGKVTAEYAKDKRPAHDAQVSRLHTSFVLGYHGCDRTIGEQALAARSS